MNTLSLINGVQIPAIGFGTWRVPEGQVPEAVKTAIQLGYNHIDTAQTYRNEKGVGEGIRLSGISREDLFLTSKVSADHKDYRSAAAGIDESLAKLGVDYLDLMLIHSPQPWTAVNQSEDRYFEGNREAWRALTDAYRAGKIRAIGVSNFLPVDLDSLWETAEVKPMVNQILCHISNTPMDLIEFCRNKGMTLEAYSPIAHGEALKNQKIAKMAEKYQVSIPQLCIRYDLQLGMVVIPKTIHPEYMKSNLDVDFEISEEDMDRLIHIEKIKDYGEFSNIPIYGGKRS